MPDILVTGATGLLGSRVVDRLRHADRVWAMARNPPRDARGVRWIAHDLSEPRPAPSLPPRVDSVVHLAQSRNLREFPEEALDVFEVNVGSTARLLDWARRAGARSFVLASSGGVYRHDDRSLGPSSAPRGEQRLSYYLASKRSAELLAEPYASALHVVILRFFFIYGPGQRSDMLIPRLVHAVATGEPVVLAGRDGIRLNPVHVDDAAAAVERAVSLEESTTFDVAGPDVLTVRQIAEAISSWVGAAPTYDIADDTTARDLVGDIRTMTRLVGQPVVRFADGVREVCR